MTVVFLEQIEYFKYPNEVKTLESPFRNGFKVVCTKKKLFTHQYVKF